MKPPRYLGCIDEAGVLSPHRVGLETAVDLYGIATATMGEWVWCLQPGPGRGKHRYDEVDPTDSDPGRSKGLL